MKLVLIGDVHLYSSKLHPRHLFSKRIIGQTNLWLNRRRRFNHALFGDVMAHAMALKPDMALFSGDVTTTSLENEFADMVDYLEPMAQELPVVVVPGNHDRYTFQSARFKRMERVLEDFVPQKFPHFQPLTRRWHLMALDSARPQVMLSRGALGHNQFRELKQFLRTLKSDEGLVVLCHYPAAVPKKVPSSWTHDLAEIRKLRKELVDCEARVVFMHGHIHKPWAVPANKEDGKPPFTCINAGSPCMTSEQYPFGQGFWEINLPEQPRADITAFHHVLKPARNNAAPTDQKPGLPPQWTAARYDITGS